MDEDEEPLEEDDHDDLLNAVHGWAVPPAAPPAAAPGVGAAAAAPAGAAAPLGIRPKYLIVFF